jgi:hypothetical protein
VRVGPIAAAAAGAVFLVVVGGEEEVWEPARCGHFSTATAAASQYADRPRLSLSFLIVYLNIRHGPAERLNVACTSNVTLRIEARA